jgi:dTDP-4-amino-4,6-dideoxygalactose transaminase
MKMKSNRIPFNWPHMTGKELKYIAEAHLNGSLAGDGPFTRRCHDWLEERSGCNKALLTHSCTAALEMAALMLDIKPGDEIIMPSYTFVSTANAFVLRGGVPVFVDIREDTLNLDERLIESAITSRTRAIVPVHYAGVACEMDSIMAIARENGLKVVEDAAQALMSTYKGRGFSKARIVTLENFLIDRSISVIRLETAIHQLEDLGFYKQLGYQIREPYGVYELDPFSIFMEKRLKIE